MTFVDVVILLKRKRRKIHLTGIISAEGLLIDFYIYQGLA